MKPDQLWLDLSKSDVRVWMGPTLELAHAKGSSHQRVGFYREIPLYHLPEGSALPMGWTSFHWRDTVGKFGLDEAFWIGLIALRFTIFSAPVDNNTFTPPLAVDFPLASDVLFYGGTFDPWHEGHQSCLNLAPSELPLVVCPDRNPHKNMRVGDGIGRFLDLLKQIPLRAGQLLYPGFLLKEETNPTVNWVLRVKRNRPDLRIHLLMGHDNFALLSTWNQASDLMKLLSGIQVVSRQESDADRDKAKAWVLEQNPKLTVTFLGHHPHEDKSSTNLRQKN